MFRSNSLLLLTISLLPITFGCKRSDHSKAKPLPAGIENARPHTIQKNSQSASLFSKMTSAETGIDFISRIDNEHPMSRLYISGFASGGIAIGDVDGDGLPDIYLTNGPDANKLYRQTENLKFEDITAKAGVAANQHWSAGAAFADVDQDGDLDLYVCNYDSPNLLYINNGSGKFIDKASNSDADIADASVMSHFCDYDRDGDLDMFLLTNRLYRQGGLPTGKISKTVNGKTTLLPEFQRYYDLIQVGPNRYTAKTSGRPNRLFENDGKGNFRDVSKAAGVDRSGKGLSAVWYDFDRDGLMDIYVANDFDDPDHLYRNLGDGTFKDVIRDVVPHTTWFSMGSDTADLNNDGMVDLMVLDMSATSHYRQKVTMGDMSSRQRFMDYSNPRQLMRNAVFLNSGVGRFLESAHMSGLASSDWSWAVKLADFDNDGLNDAFVTNGMTSDLTNADRGLNQKRLVSTEEWQLVKTEPRQKDKNLAFRNTGDLKFKPAAKEWGLDHHGMSYSAAYGDLDRDGDLDLIVTNLEEPIQVYRNDSVQDNRVTFSLKGTKNNRFGIGSKLTIKHGETKQVRVLNPMTGFMSSNEPIVHFGLGNSEQIDELNVEWPDGSQQTLTDLQAGKHYVIEETASESSPASTGKNEPPMFAFSKELWNLQHRETEFDDFAIQPLLPNKLSQLGPGLAIADINDDGNQDFFVGAAKGQSSKILVRGKQSTSIALNDNSSILQEDFAPLFFDVDQDGDQDLYVVSGGVEAGNDEKLLLDRLYLNQGSTFTLASPEMFERQPISGSVAAAADFDRDGDLDLFVGGRVQPGSYPLGANCQLLRNDSQKTGQTKLVNSIQTVAAGLEQIGMVTSALWSDVDNDGWVDLLVTTEWGPIRTFLNKQGKLVDATEASGLAKYLGWWNGIAGRDLDNDGDIDYVVTNFGLNTKYHPTFAHPSRIYFGTFGDETKPHIVEAKVGDDCVLPVRGKSCSQNAMPFVGKKFETYHDFALASLTDIYSDARLQHAKVFEANTLDSSILLNDGNGKFEIRALPKLAQISPGFGVVATEIDGDGFADIYLVQNFYHPQRETGKMAGGMSLLLTGDGTGKFRERWPSESGLMVAVDAKGLATCDLNHDNWVDLAITINHGPTFAFENRNGKRSDNTSLKVRLAGPTGNPTAIGARVMVELDNGSKQTDEVRAGGSYLSQSSPELFFGVPAGANCQKISIRWPDGSSSEYLPKADERSIVIKQD